MFLKILIVFFDFKLWIYVVFEIFIWVFSGYGKFFNYYIHFIIFT